MSFLERIFNRNRSREKDKGKEPSSVRWISASRDELNIDSEQMDKKSADFDYVATDAVRVVSNVAEDPVLTQQFGAECNMITEPAGTVTGNNQAANVTTHDQRIIRDVKPAEPSILCATAVQSSDVSNDKPLVSGSILSEAAASINEVIAQQETKIVMKDSDQDAEKGLCEFLMYSLHR